jgi:hypothetical protein
MINFCHAQVNLVPNPSFEDTVNCPSNISQLYNCSNWIAPTAGTSDYFNACASAPTGVSIPNNGAGFQQPKNGNGYAGLSPYQRSSPTGPFNYREYIQTMLVDSLITNNVYCVSFYLNCASISSISIDKVGLYFSNFAINSSTSLSLPYIPQIESPPSFYLTDTLGWYKVEGTYTALGGEKYITIGNFRDEVTTDTIHTDPLFASSSYYYIDDVSVINCNDTISSINEINQQYDVKLYPNPNNGTFTIECNVFENESAVLNIYDVTGKKIAKHFVNSKNKSLTINENSLDAGVYYYQITVNDKTIKSNKLVIIK